MKKGLWILALLASLSVTACSSNDSTQPVVEKQVASAIQSAQLIDEDLDAIHKRENIERAAKQFNAAFNRTSGWVEAVRGADGSSVCEMRDRYNELSGAMGYIDGKYSDKLNWSDVAVPENTARAALNDASVKYATELNRLLEQPLSKRKSMGQCGAGEGTMELTDSSYLTRDLIEALKSADQIPEDVGTTPAKMRARLLGDFIALINERRAEVKKNPKAWGPGILIRDSVGQWNFTQEQLKLTDEEMKETW